MSFARIESRLTDVLVSVSDFRYVPEGFFRAGACAASAIMIAEAFGRDLPAHWAYIPAFFLLMAAISFVVAVLLAKLAWPGPSPATIWTDRDGLLRKQLSGRLSATDQFVLASLGVALVALLLLVPVVPLLGGAAWVLAITAPRLTGLLGSVAVRWLGVACFVAGGVDLILVLLGAGSFALLGVGILLAGVLLGDFLIGGWRRGRGLRRLTTGTAVVAFAVLVLELMPAWIVAYVALIGAIVALRWIAADAALRGAGRQGQAEPAQPVTGTRSSVVRRSDGYARLCHPRWRQWGGGAEGSDSGYLYSLGSTDRRDPCLEGIDGEAVIFRSTTLAPHSVQESPDPTGRALSALVRPLLPLGTLEKQIAGITDAFNEPATVDIVRMNDVKLLAKMPWDSPFLHVVPVDGHVTFQYPPYSGIVDADGRPYDVFNVAVQIRVKDDALEAVRRCAAEMLTPSGPGDADLDTSRRLLWYSGRVVSAAYEGALSILADQVPALREIDQANVKPALDARLQSSLHPEIAGLFQVRVLGLEIEPFLEEEISIYRRESKREEERGAVETRGDLTKLRRELTDASRQVDSDRKKLSVLRADALIDRIRKNSHEVSAELAEASKKIRHAFENLPRTSDGGMQGIPRAIEDVEQRRLKFDTELSAATDRMIKSARELNELLAQDKI